jgi:N6-adenosine-specific RNA methylase IME4
MIELPDKKYGLIYADPPWRYKFSKTAAKAIEKHYPTMDLESIKNLPVQNISADDCLLLMWATFPKLEESFQVIKSWGFEYKTIGFVWIKVNKRTDPNQYSFLPEESFDGFWGLGHWTRSNSEICLLATKGSPKRKSSSVHQLIYAPIQKHSQKPNETRERIVELVGDIPKIELFARKSFPGWDCWGNEV